MGRRKQRGRDDSLPLCAEETAAPAPAIPRTVLFPDCGGDADLTEEEERRRSSQRPRCPGRPSHILIADCYNNRIRVISADLQQVSTVAGNGTR